MLSRVNPSCLDGGVDRAQATGPIAGAAEAELQNAEFSIYWSSQKVRRQKSASTSKGDRLRMGAYPLSLHASPANGIEDEASYRPEIDGLRAVAVLSVIANHVNRAWLPMGFLGVDVFFVISGFVITRSLHAGTSPSLFHFMIDFYGRRIRRLAPALIVCFLASAGLVWFLVPEPQESLRIGISSLFGLSNVALYRQKIDYFAQARDLNVFLQTWSLGVEEQFYLFFPLLLWSLGFRKGRAVGRFSAVVGLLSLASLLAYFAFLLIDAEASYYLMPMRFWELAAGALLFAALPRLRLHLRHSGSMVALFAALVLVVSLGLPPGVEAGALIAVVLATVMIIATTSSPGLIRTVLCHRAMVFIGLISYPLYLWHWAVLSLGRWTLGPDIDHVPFQLGLIFLLSVLTWRFVERPLRYSVWLGRGRRAIGVYVVSAVVCATAAAVVANNLNIKFFGISSAKAYYQRSLPPAFLPLEQSGRSYLDCVVGPAHASFTQAVFDDCTVPASRSGAPTIWTVGDSHAGHLQNLLYKLHERLGMGGHLIETPGQAFPPRRGQDPRVRQEIFDAIKDRMKANDVLLVGRLFLMRDGSGQPFPDVEEWAAQVAKLAADLAPRGVSVVVMGPPPMFHFDAIAACWSRLGAGSSCETSRAGMASNVETVLHELERVRVKNLFVFDPFSVLCPPISASCSPLQNGIVAFRDKDHLNSYGSALLAQPFIEFLQANGLLN